MSVAKIEVLPFDFDAFKSVLGDASGSAPELICKKQQVDYFQSYFSTIAPLAMVIEHEYVDRDYLEDYAAYYVRCFHGYPRYCKRVHFFGFGFKDEDFKHFLAGEPSSIDITALQENYLGFMVLKPIPLKVIGRTCLKCYEPTGGRSYPIKKAYQVNLAGVTLSIESLAFQEQDSVAAACATSALWSAFHATGLKFHHPIPSPVEITKAAASNGLKPVRTFPNIDGLTLPEMAQAVRSVGLEPHTFATTDEVTFRSAIYSYLSAGIPIILAVGLWDVGGDSHTRLGGHAVAITGFGIDQDQATPIEPSQMIDFSSRINRIFVHDDGVGPFARMELDGSVVTLDPENGVTNFSLTTSWKTHDGRMNNVRAVPEYMIVPVYHKIRIPMRQIHNYVLQFDYILELIRAAANIPTLKSRFEWKLALSTSNEIKTDLFNGKLLPPAVRSALLQSNFPRFIGRATALCGDLPVAELLFDLTGLDQASAFLAAVPYDPDFTAMLKIAATDPVIKESFSDAPFWEIFDWYNDKIH